MSRQFWVDRIAIVEAQIAAYEGVLDAFAANNTLQSYSIDTGQSRTNVSRSQLASIRLLLDGLYNRLAVLNARVYGSAGVMRPDF